MTRDELIAELVNTFDPDEEVVGACPGEGIGGTLVVLRKDSTEFFYYDIVIHDA